MAENTKRTSRLNLRVQDSVIEKLNVVAVDMGMPPSTIAAYAVSEYINKYFTQRQFQNSIADQVSNNAADLMQQMMQSPEIRQLMASAIERDDDSQLTLGGV